MKKSIQYHENIYYYMQYKYNSHIALLDVNKAPLPLCMNRRNLTRLVCRSRSCYYIHVNVYCYISPKWYTLSWSLITQVDKMSLHVRWTLFSNLITFSDVIRSPFTSPERLIVFLFKNICSRFLCSDKLAWSKWAVSSENCQQQNSSCLKVPG